MIFSPTVVVDASLAVKWVLEEPYTQEAISLLHEWADQQIQIIAPSLLAFEAANAIYKRVSRSQLSLEIARQRLITLLAFGMTFHQPTGIHTRALELAHQFGRPTPYDSHYLALAEREGGECWTADERLWNTVKSELSWVHWVGEGVTASSAR